jgi:3-oxoacyl-[acyl-carrier protein] reductase
MTPELGGQVAVVTGASRGIGLAIAASLRACGATVIDASRSASPPTDLADETSIAACFTRVREQHGRLDILVNNAGIGVFGPTAEFSTHDLDRILAVNVRGTFLCCREAVKLMLPQRGGTIINIASVVGIKGYVNQAAYTASKHAVMGLTKSLAAELQPRGIGVSVVLPGGVDTDMAGDARPDLDRSVLLKPDDVADCVLHLLSLPARAWIDQIYIRRRSSSPF